MKLFVGSQELDILRIWTLETTLISVVIFKFWVVATTASYRNLFYLQLTINYEIRLFSMSKSVRKGVKCETDMRPAQTNSEMFFVFTFITYGASWHHEEGSLWYIYFRFIDVPKWEKNILGCNSLVRSVGPHFQR